MDMIATTNSVSPATNNATIDGVSSVVPQVNGVLKRHQKNHHVVVAGAAVYKECLKNHAASMGGHAVDGCGEFMPSQTATATDPTSLKCAACGCHRNFHRREGVLGGVASARVVEYHPQHRHHPPPPPPAEQSPGSDNHSPPPISSTYFPSSAPHMLLALSSGGGGNGDDSPKMNNITNNATKAGSQPMLLNSHSSPNFSSRKRFRTKFTQEQKDKMQEFAEKLGWKMQKSTDELVKGFCASIGVQREVFKVWMHNNKNTFNKRSATTNYIVSSNHDGGLATLNNININNNNNNIKNSDSQIMKEDYEHVDGNGDGVGNSHSSSVNNSENIEGAHHHHHHRHHHHHHQFINNGRTPTNASSSSS